MTPRDAYQGMRKLASFMTGRYTPQGLPEDTITRKIQSNEIPTPSDVRRFVGSDEIIIRSLYFTLAVLHDIRRREGGRPYFTHVYSVAIKPDYRSHDPDVPAGYTTTSFEKLLGLNHETREEFGRTPLGSHVVGATIKDFFGKELAEGIDKLTNANDIVMHTIEDSLKTMDPERYKRLEAHDVSERLKRELEGVKVDPKAVRRQYLKVKNVLVNFVNDTKQYHPEISPDDRNFIVDILQDSFIAPLTSQLRADNIADPDGLADRIRNEFSHTIHIVENGPYFEADRKLTHPDESPYIVTLDKTLYQDFLNIMNEYAFQKALAQRASGILNGSALSVPIVKASDITSNVATMEDNITHAMHVYRNARRFDLSGKQLIERLGQAGFDNIFYQRFAHAIDYAGRVLISVLKEKPEILRVKAKSDNVYERDIPLFEYMLNKTIDNDNGKPKTQKKGLTAFMW